MQPPIRYPSTQIVSPSLPFVLYIQHSKSGSISIAIAKLLLNLFDAAAGVRARQEQEHSTKRERRKEVGSVAGWLAGWRGQLRNPPIPIPNVISGHIHLRPAREQEQEPKLLQIFGQHVAGRR